IDQAQKDGVARHRLEIVDTLAQGILEVGHSDRPDGRWMDLLCSGEGLLVCHGHSSRNPMVKKKTARGGDLFPGSPNNDASCFRARSQAARCAASPLASATMIL